jgi:hypothetical protein
MRRWLILFCSLGAGGVLADEAAPLDNFCHDPAVWARMYLPV